MFSVQYCSQVMVTLSWWLNVQRAGNSDPVDKHASGISDEWNISHVPTGQRQDFIRVYKRQCFGKGIG